MRRSGMSFRTRPLIRIAAAVQLGIGVLSLVLALLSGWDTQWWNTSSGASKAGLEPTSAEVTALLNRHAAALRNHDRKTFAADLDNDKVARNFYNEQLAAFDNISQVPLASWDLTLVTMVATDQATSDVIGRVAAPARIAKVQLSYALTGIDSAPTRQSLWLSLVRRGNDVRITADSDLADQAGQSWKGPWDFGPVVVTRGKSSIVLAHPGNAAELASLAATFDAAVDAVTRIWGTGWTRKVAVFIPDTQDEMTRVIGKDLDLQHLSAVSVADVSDPQNKLFLGQRVVVNPQQLDNLSEVGRQIVVTHEVALIAVRPAVGPDLPVWLIEGFAEYVANLDTGQAVSVAAAELRRDTQAGKFPTALPTTQDFYTDNLSLPQAYEQAWLACRFIADKVGPAGLVSFVKQVSDATQAVSVVEPDAAVNSALTTALGIGTPDFVAQWNAYLRQVLT